MLTARAPSTEYPIIGILIGLLLPAINAAREAGRRTQCVNNVRQWSLAHLGYEQDHGACNLGIMS